MSIAYSQILTRGNKSSLASAPIVDGKVRFATDTEQLYIDFGNSRIEITDVIRSYTDAEIKQLASPLEKFYFASDTKLLYYYDSTSSSWKTIGGASNTPTFEEAETRENINSGETLSILFGKIKKWFSSLGSLAFKNSISSSDINTSDGLDFGDEDDTE